MLDAAPVNCSIPAAAPVPSSPTSAGTNAGSEDTAPATSPVAAGAAIAGDAAMAAALLPPYHGPHPFLPLLKLNPKFLFYLHHGISIHQSRRAGGGIG